MPRTLNKDGTPRKTGSGKTKGAGCYSPVTWSELKNLISDDVQIPVSRVWLRSLGGLGEDKPAPRILVKPNGSLSSRDVSSERNQASKPPESHFSKEPEQAERAPVSGEEYEPPPLFAGSPGNLGQY